MDRDFLHHQLVKLGDMLGDGLGYEEPWIGKEYRKIYNLLYPPTKEEKQAKAEIRRKKNENINKQIEEKLKTNSCTKCNSKLKQTRSGSKVVQCINEQCKAKFQYKSKKK